MTQTMIERAAIALCRARHDEFNQWGSLGEDERDQFRLEVRAVVESMLDPSDAIINEMEEMYMPMGDMSLAWRGAITAILNEDSGK